jgi:hypothetical protein
LEKISLSKLIPKEPIIGPLNFHDRFSLQLPTLNSSESLWPPPFSTGVYRNEEPSPEGQRDKEIPLSQFISSLFEGVGQLLPGDFAGLLMCRPRLLASGDSCCQKVLQRLSGSIQGVPASQSILQHQLDDLKIFTFEHSMKLNSRKTKCMPYINSKTKEFVPQLRLEDDSFLKVIYEMKLVGLVITSDLQWNSHVNYTVGRVNKVIWQLVRFKQLGAPREKLKTLYILKIRSILMFGAVCYHSSLPIELSRKLEMQQKRSLAVILGQEYGSYSNALLVLNLPRLDNLRETAFLKWALKAQQDPRHSDLLLPNTNNTRHKSRFIEPLCRTTKYYKSAIPSMTRALNHHFRNNDPSP